ncbi:MAG: DUF971 domain-containing protein [Methylocystaceae bacterium]|nr:DUF971 domain-containing protein [Methylocystaceae bacterium]
MAISPEGGNLNVTELRVKKEEKALIVTFDNGDSFQIPAELLRVESPSAEVQGHNPSEKKIIAGRRHVGIIGAEPVGNYAVKLTFDDLHDTGIFTWGYLHWLGDNMNDIWDEYLTNLAAAGLSRDP